MPSLLQSQIISAKDSSLITVDLLPVIHQRRCKTFRSTQSVWEASNNDEKKSSPLPKLEKIKMKFQIFKIPIHHSDPDKEKIMLEDFPEGEAPMVPLPPLDDGSGKVIAPPHLHDLADEIVGMTMLEVKELVDRVAEHFGIEEGDDDAVASAGDGASVEEEVVVAKTSFDLKLTGFNSKDKIKVIKEIRAITGLGLKEAKELVEGVPKTIKKDIKMEEAEDIKAKLEAVGATVEIE
jgi:ribosomal protein L7/L12